MVKKLSQKEIEQLLEDSKKLKQLEAEIELKKQKAREAAAKRGYNYKKAYERHKKRMATDPEYAARQKAAAEAYRKKRQRKIKEMKAELEEYKKRYGELPSEQPA